jgi:hypothetical protein
MPQRAAGELEARFNLEKQHKKKMNVTGIELLKELKRAEGTLLPSYNVSLTSNAAHSSRPKAFVTRSTK